MAQGVIPTTINPSFVSSVQTNKPQLAKQPKGTVDAMAFSNSMSAKRKVSKQPRLSDLVSQELSKREQTWYQYEDQLLLQKERMLEMRKTVIDRLEQSVLSGNAEGINLDQTKQHLMNALDGITQEYDHQLRIIDERQNPLQPSKILKPAKTMMQCLTRGEQQLRDLEAEIERVFIDTNGSIEPGMLLRFQLRINHVTQQLELSSNVLNKALDGIKTTFNTQV
jgi:hypothetical protein